MPPLRRRRFPRLVLSVVLALAASPVIAGAQLRFLDQAPESIPEDQLGVLSGYFQMLLDNDGLALDVIRDSRFEWHLDAGSRYEVSIEVPEGGDVSVFGVCDDDCENLDLEVLDGSDGVVGSDAEDDAFPVVQFTADRGSRYLVRVEMTACSREPCFFGLAGLTDARASSTPAAAPRAPDYEAEDGGIVVPAGDPQGPEMTRLLTHYIEEAGKQNLQKEGFLPTGARHMSALDDGEDAQVWMDVAVAGRFAILGICDNECEDLDFELYDESGAQLDEDVMVDALPLVTFSNAGRTRYRLRVVMVTCTVGPCGYAFEVFKGR